MKSSTLRIPAHVRVRDAITLMNEWFLTSAVIVGRGDDVVGTLDRESIARQLADDADTLLRARCIDVIRLEFRATAA